LTTGLSVGALLGKSGDEKKKLTLVIVLTNARCDMMLSYIEAGYFRMHLSITSWLYEHFGC